ncbi:MAG: DUF4118 domain-containing protein [Actinomycetota bacterium]
MNPAGAPPFRARPFLAVAACLAGPLVVGLALVPVRARVTSANVALVFVVCVLAAAIGRGRLGATLAALSGAFWFDVLFTRPYNSVTINRADDMVTTGLLVAVGLIAGELVVRARRSERVAHAARRDVEKLQRISELAAGGEPAGALVRLVQEELVDLLGLRGCRWERPPYASELPVLRHGRVRVVAGSATDAEHLVRSPRNQVALPVWGDGRELGRFVLVLPFDASGISFRPQDREAALALVDQLGAALAPAWPA